MRIVVLSIIAVAVGLAIGSAVANFRVGSSEDFDLYRSYRLLDAKPVTGGARADLAAPSVARGVPSFSVDETKYDFGEMQRGSEQSRTFTVTNKGDAPLSVRVGNTSCKCTVGDVEQRPIAPNESVPVKLTWTAKSLPGPFRQTATLITTDPRQPQVELAVEGVVTDVSGLEPQMWYFGRMRAGEPQTASVTLMAYQQSAVEVTKAEVTRPEAADWFDIKIVPLDQGKLPDPVAKAGVRVDVTAKKGLPLGEINEWIHIESNLPPDSGRDVWAREVGIAGRVEGDLSIRGTQWSEPLGAVNLGWVDGAKGGEAKLFISTKGERAGEVKFEVVSVEPSVVEIEIGEPKQIREGVTHTDLVVRIPPGTATMNHLGSDQGEAATVRLKTGHPVTPEMTFGVRFGVR